MEVHLDAAMRRIEALEAHQCPCHQHGHISVQEVHAQLTAGWSHCISAAPAAVVSANNMALPADATVAVLLQLAVALVKHHLLPSFA